MHIIIGWTKINKEICKVIARPRYINLCFELPKRQLREDSNIYTLKKLCCLLENLSESPGYGTFEPHPYLLQTL